MSFSNVLVSWYLDINRDLPWRASKNPYHVWLSEIILQQTRVSQGLPYFLKFTNAFPTVFDLANSSENNVLKLWQGLGYYSRARNLHFTAKFISTELNGVFPNKYKDLIKLKGIGDYTASAIASICFNEPNAVVDGNVYRVLARYYGINTPINTTPGIKEFKILAQELLDTSQPGTHNQAIMDFGALHCKPQAPLCDSCNLSNSCNAFTNNQVAVLPVKLKKIKIKKRYLNFLVTALPSKKIAFKQNTGKGIWQALYKFPFIESLEDIDVETLISYDEFDNLFPNETDISLFENKTILHKLTHQHLYIKFWIIKTETVNTDVFSISQINSLPMPIVIANFLERFQD